GAGYRYSPTFTREARDFHAAVCNIRYFEFEQSVKGGDARSQTYGQIIDRWTSVESVRVKPVAREFGHSGVAEHVIANAYTERDLEWLKGRGMKPSDIQRPPRSGDWQGIRPEDIAEGERRVIVNA